VVSLPDKLRFAGRCQRPSARSPAAEVAREDPLLPMIARMAIA